MDDLVQLERLSFRYSGSVNPILNDVTVTIHKGDKVLIRGRSGSGKSTLLLVMAQLAPEYIMGTLTGERILHYRTKGVVLQNPEAQVVTPTVEEEVAFALENKGVATDTIRKKVHEVLDLFGLTPLAHRHPLNLSGGECQRVSLAAAFAVEPDILFLDEPTSYLDERSAKAFFEGLSFLSSDTAVVIVEHRVSETVRFCTDAYEVNLDGTLKKTGFNVPKIAYPKAKKNIPDNRRSTSYPPVLEIKNLRHRYKREEEDLFSGINLRLQAGQLAALLGPSGCGKTTLLAKIIHMLPHKDGSVFLLGKDSNSMKKHILHGHFMFVPQNPEHMYIAYTLREEVSAFDKAIDIAKRFGLGGKLDANVFRLSEGEKRRVNLSVAFASKRPLYLLDEPTYGLDAAAKQLLSVDIRTLTEQGAAVLFVTHDKDFAEHTADALFVMEEKGLHRKECYGCANVQA